MRMSPTSGRCSRSVVSSRFTSSVTAMGAPSPCCLPHARRSWCRSVGVVSAHVRGEDTTVATLRRMGPPDQWPEPMRRSLRRSHGDDWIDVAGAWHALWTSSAWERWSIVDELPAIGCPVYAMHALQRRSGAAAARRSDSRRAAAGGITWVDTSSHDPHRVRPERFAADLDSCGGLLRTQVADHFNCSEWLVDRHVAAGRAHRTALTSGDASATYDELLDLVVSAAGGLRGLGVRSEERVLISPSRRHRARGGNPRRDAHRRRRPPGQSPAPRHAISWPSLAIHAPDAPSSRLTPAR